MGQIMQNRKNKQKRGGKHIVILFGILVWAAWEVSHPVTLVIHNDTPWMAPIVIAAAPDPCGLEVVVCPGEQEPVIAKTVVERKVIEAFPEDPAKALRVFRCESGLNPKKHSGVDRLADGRAFSVGLAQINLTVSRVGGLDCSQAFVGRNSQATVLDEGLYGQCVRAAEDIDNSLKSARAKYDGPKNWSAWFNCDNRTK